MKKTSNSLSKSSLPTNMDRKATIKKYADLLAFPIYENGTRILKIQIPTNATVSDLLAEVKQGLGSNIKDFIGLVSRDNNQIIDYTLKMKYFPLANYPHVMELDVQRKGEVQNNNEPSLNDFQFLKLLGSGVSASVYLVRHKCNGMLYAMKQIKKSYFKEFKRMEQVLRQRKIMIEHIIDIPFTTRLIASFESERFLNFVIEYCPGGEMFLHLQRKKLTEEEAKLYVAEMVIAFEKLHQKKIIYRDLKPENIMIDFDGHAKLGDFGLCKINLQYYDLTYSYCGSEEYMAPEVKAQSGYNYSVDFYTLGSFAYELVMGVPPYFNNEPLSFREDATDEYIELVTRLIEGNMHRRLKSFNEIKRMKWFKSIEWKKVLDKKYTMPYKLDVSENYIGDQFKNEIIDPDISDQQRFDKLLECFFYLSDDNAGISQFYGRKKEHLKKSMESSHKKKRLSFEASSNQNSRKSSQSKSSNRSIKSNPKDKNIFRKNQNPLTNIYTTQNITEKNTKKMFNSGDSSKSRKKLNGSIGKSSVNNSSSHNKKLKKPEKMEEKIEKITMKKVKSSANLMNSNTYTKVMELRNVFSPRKMASPKKMRLND